MPASSRSEGEEGGSTVSKCCYKANTAPSAFHHHSSQRFPLATAMDGTLEMIRGFVVFHKSNIFVSVTPERISSLSIWLSFSLSGFLFIFYFIFSLSGFLFSRKEIKFLQAMERVQLTFIEGTQSLLFQEKL